MKRAQRFRYVPHTADVAFIAYGRNFNETLENSAAAMLNVMFDIKKIEGAKGEARTLRITEHAKSDQDMLWFALQKIVSKVDEKGVAAIGFKVNHLTRKKNGITLHGCIFYKRVNDYSALLDVKAVTPHTLEIRRTKAGYRAHVILDV